MTDKPALTWGDMEAAARRAAAMNGTPLAVPAASVERVVEKVTPLFADAFTRRGQGERISWELALQVLPDPSRQAWNPGLFVYAEVAGAVPPTGVAVCFGPMVLSGWDQDNADHIVDQIMTSLQQGRAREVQAMQDAALQAAAEGREAPHGGLILPG